MTEQNKYRGLWVTDFDGTIKPANQGVAQADIEALKRLGKDGWCRVVATGRSLFAFARDWTPGLELDALIFSTGSGLCSWGALGPGPMLKSFSLSDQESKGAVEAAMQLGFGFFAYLAPPDSHHFYYLPPTQPSPPTGFNYRLKQYPAQCRPWPKDALRNNCPPSLSQIMIMVPTDIVDQTEAKFHQLSPGLSVLRSTSPFEDNHMWLEIFAPGVSKSHMATKLSQTLSLGTSTTVALGNDYNDIDLLKWAGCAFVTSDAPAKVRSNYRTIAVAGQGGLAQAAEIIASEQLHNIGPHGHQPTGNTKI